MKHRFKIYNTVRAMLTEGKNKRRYRGPIEIKPDWQQINPIGFDNIENYLRNLLRLGKNIDLRVRYIGRPSEGLNFKGDIRLKNDKYITFDQDTNYTDLYKTIRSLMRDKLL